MMDRTIVRSPVLPVGDEGNGFWGHAGFVCFWQNRRERCWKSPIRILNGVTQHRHLAFKQRKVWKCQS